MRRSVIAFLSASIVTLVFIFAGVFVSSAQSGGCADNDNDGVCNTDDNCTDVANPAQRDDNLDGFGNICDADVDNDCTTGTSDIAAIRANWGMGAPTEFDVDENGTVGAGDIALANGSLLTAPGPSGLACASCSESGACAD